MRVNPQLNGSDYLMLGFDYELRRRGFAGNSCQIVLELNSYISPDALKKRLADLMNRYPILNARPGGIFLPKWKLPRRIIASPQIRVQRDSSDLRQQLADETLAMKRGELLRFDLIERDGGRMDVVFTWAHALMDANSAVHFLAVVGREDIPLPAAQPISPPRAKKPLKERFKLAWKNIHQLDEFCKAAPRSVGLRFPNAPARQKFRVEKFSADETTRIRANAARLCGALGGAQFHASVSMVELHRLHQRLGCASPSYVLPVPVGLRLKGSVEPLFSNQMTMLMAQFLPEQLNSTADAVATLKSQTASALRAGLLESGVVLAELFRFLPLPTYVAMLKQGLRGEICSLFYGDTAAVTPLLTTFLGAAIEDFAHIGATTPSPGLGVIFYFFRGLMRVTVFHLENHFSEIEVAEFAAKLRQRLLNP
ncbi:MAG TPA: hypothetical protein VHX90_03670 [Verrucomicrobiae bacterium]|nr:hypothetical protein [Verrucomicrobiae bacterium]